MTCFIGILKKSRKTFNIIGIPQVSVMAYSFWASLMKVKRDFLRFGTFIIKDGSQVRFWEDIWLGNRSLRDQYPQLYNIVRKKQDTADVLSTQIPNLSWC